MYQSYASARVDTGIISCAFMRHHTHGLSGKYLAEAHKTHASYRDFLLGDWLRVKGTHSRRMRGMANEQAEPQLKNAVVPCSV